MKITFLLCAFLWGAHSYPAFAAEVELIGNGYHIVVATYSERQEKEARVYSESLNKRGLTSGYGLEKGKNFIYVFLQTFDFDHFSDAVKAMTEVRKKPEFATAWVVKIKDGREIKEGDPVEDVVVKETIPAPKEPIIVTEYIENPPMKPITRPQHLGNTPVFMSVFRDRDGKLIDADIKVIDTEKSKQLTVVKSNRYLNLPDPRTKSGKLSLVASAFGYKDMQLDIGYYTTEQDTIQQNVTLFGSYFQFIFPLEKMVKGQEFTLSKVAFFNDAAIMTPNSSEQLNALLETLQDNPTTRIRLNGYTNSNGRGKIIYAGPSKNFFALSSDRVEKTGSAKELSAARAQVIKDWLVVQGIAEDRIEVVGWGGVNQIYDKDSPNARKNARVELEVLQ
ncbi:MAG TPA: OmpA family protein [Cyclobacteriaceae bacterium]|jgi:outer membrane protein OmpA-like peptidoglycan-associated protein|nr:OmpA family protein [Cyclobacteriaceae bacterium]